jgi:hypothetical protein
MNFLERITGIFTKTEDTIKDILAEPRIEEAAVIVAVFTIIALATSYISSQHLVQGQGNSISIANLAISIIWPFIGWFIATAIVYGLAMVFFGGEGKFSPQMLTAIGFTYSAKVIFAVIALLLLMLTPVVAVPAISQTSPTSDELRQLADVLSSFMYNPFYILSFLAGIIGLIWSCYMGMLAVKNGMKISMKRAAIVVGVPMVVYIVLMAAFTFGSVMLIQWAANAL